MCWSAILASASVGAAQVADAKEASELIFRPAALTDRANSIQNRVRFPKGSTDVSVAFDCTSVASDHGEIGVTSCIPVGSSSPPFERAVGNAVERALVAPAIADGRPRTVRLQYRVAFERQGTQERVQVLLNHGLQVRTFGAAYSGPQRILEGKTLPFSCDRDFRVSVSATVTEEGRAEGVALEPGSTGGEQCRADIVESFRTSRFIPAFADGKPVRALVREIFFWRCSTQTRQVRAEAAYTPLQKASCFIYVPAP